MPGNSRRLERRRSRSADIGSDNMDGGSSKNYVRMKFSDIVDQSSQGSRGRSRAVSPASTPRERDSNSGSIDMIKSCVYGNMSDVHTILLSEEECSKADDRRAGC